MIFDTLKYVNMMNKAGFNQEKSETLIQVWSHVMKSELVTKKDLHIALLEQDNRLIFKMYRMQFISIGLTVTLIKLIPTIH